MEIFTFTPLEVRAAVEEFRTQVAAVSKRLDLHVHSKKPGSRLFVAFDEQMDGKLLDEIFLFPEDYVLTSKSLCKEHRNTYLNSALNFNELTAVYQHQKSGIPTSILMAAGGFKNFHLVYIEAKWRLLQQSSSWNFNAEHKLAEEKIFSPIMDTLFSVNLEEVKSFLEDGRFSLPVEPAALALGSRSTRLVPSGHVVAFFPQSDFVNLRKEDTKEIHGFRERLTAEYYQRLTLRASTPRVWFMLSEDMAPVISGPTEAYTLFDASEKGVTLSVELFLMMLNSHLKVNTHRAVEQGDSSVNWADALILAKRSTEALN